MTGVGVDFGLGGDAGVGFGGGEVGVCEVVCLRIWGFGVADVLGGTFWAAVDDLVAV